LVPTNQFYTWLVVFYVIGGMLLATTCIDAVGIHYLNKLHFFGRKLGKTDPLQWLKGMKIRRMQLMKKKRMEKISELSVGISEEKTGKNSIKRTD